MKKLGTTGIILSHLSHLYQQGTSVYFILLCPRLHGREVEQWHLLKSAATEAIITSGGGLSHHHGIGTDHSPWIARSMSRGNLSFLKIIKNSLDPENIMNPGKLLP